MCGLYGAQFLAKDILARLRALLELGADCTIKAPDLHPLITEAVDEIEHLRRRNGQFGGMI